MSLAQAYISDVTEPKNRAKAFGVIGISFGIGFLIGPAISGFLSQYGYQYPPLAAAALSFTSIMGTTFLLPAVSRTQESAEDKKKTSIIEAVFHWKNYFPFFKNPATRRLLIQFFLFALSFAMFISGMALFCERRFSAHGHPFGPKEVGYLFAFSGLLGIFIQGGLLGRMVKKFGEAKMVLVSFTAMGLGYGLLTFPRSVPFLLVVLALSGFGSGVVRPVLTSLITQAADRNQQGVILGLNQSLNAIAQIIGPLISGALISLGYLEVWPWATAVGALIASLMAIALVRNHQATSKT